MQKTLALVDDPLFCEHHAPAGHPERPERLHAARAAIARTDFDLRRTDLATRSASEDELLRVHHAQYLEQLGQAAGQVGYFDEDTFYSEQSVSAARAAAGAALVITDVLLDGRADFGLALVRPPGHHARPSGAMGFCLLNNIAVAAAHARARGVERVAIVDFDVHHGNGTQEMFYTDPSLLFISLHQSPLYPGTGSAEENGARDGRGYTINVPLSPGAGDAAYGAAIERIVAPVLESYQPGLLLFSAGFDAHSRDPLAQMELTDQGFRTLVQRTLAALRPGTPVGMTLEGGYDLLGLGSSLGAVLTGLGEGPVQNIPAERLWQAHERDLRAAAAVAAESWKLG
ncbi:MAG TPA: histone deacetylase [Polyangiaceae bacterium]|nr:histone deacetylase [Polyangiaceae bacterium]